MKRLGLTFLGAATLAFLGFVLPHLSGMKAAPPKPPMSTPLITCVDSTPAAITLEVCGGATGAPAGFSIQWMTADDYAANGNMWYLSEDERLCKGSFSGNANQSRYNLGPNECVRVEIGDILFDNGASTNCPDALRCGTTYVFRAFAHATNALRRSEFTPNLECSTAPCPEECFALSQGYWRNHFSAWPQTVLDNGLNIGNVHYTAAELLQILQRNPSGGNKLVILAHQVIAVELSIRQFGPAPGSQVQLDCLAMAHVAIGNLNALTGSSTNNHLSDLATCLDQGYVQAYHCG